MTPVTRPAIIVHGGAWLIPEEEHADHLAGCRAAVLAGYDVLKQGGSALDAVEAAVIILEDDPAFDAGTGAHLNREGRVQLDAGIMDGITLDVGAVAALEHIKNPIRVARRLLTDKYSFYVGHGALGYARYRGFEIVPPESFVVPRESARYKQRLEQQANLAASQGGSTVGAVAFDSQGNLAAGTSTGGSMFKPVGRVGDSPLPGCGYLADNQKAAVSATGHGEKIMRVQLSRTAADLAAQMRDQDKATDVFHGAAQAAVETLQRVDGEAAVIMIDALGRIGFAHSTPHLAHAYLHAGMTEPGVALQAND